MNAIRLLPAIGLLLSSALLFTPSTSQATDAQLFCRVKLTHTLNDPTNGTCAPDEDRLIIQVDNSVTEVSNVRAKINADGTIASQSKFRNSNWISATQTDGHGTYGISFSPNVFANNAACTITLKGKSTNGLPILVNNYQEETTRVSFSAIPVESNFGVSTPFDIQCSGD